MSTGKTLFVSDFDDTLVKTAANIIVKNKDSIKKLSPAEYAVYEPLPGDDFDFSEFNKLIDAQPIPRYVRLLKKATVHPKVDKVVILTARGSERPISQFLNSVGIDKGVVVVALGSSDPQDKKNYIKRQLEKGYSRVAFADDSPKNIQAAKELQNEFPNAKILVHQVKEQPEELQSNKKETLKSLLKTKVKNPRTGNDILLKTALSYDKAHPVHKQAMAMVATLAKKHNIKLKSTK